MSEKWCPVEGYEGFYEVSDLGRVRSVDRHIRRSQGGTQLARGRVLRPCRMKRGGYLGVSLWRRGRARTRYVHALVAQAFLGDPPSGHEVNHRDGDKSNNSPANLEWVTRAENVHHAIATGLMPRLGEENPAARLSESLARLIRERYDRGDRPCDIAIELGIRPAHVSSIGTRRIWRHL